MLIQRFALAAALFIPAFAFAQTEAAPQKTAEPEAATTEATAQSNKVLLKTSLGDITLEVDPVKAPKSSANFLTYVKDGFYDGTVFHRVIDNFMIQGGGFTKDLQQKPTRAPIPNESRNGLSNTRGTLAMARTADPNSATAQFYINVVDNPQLDYVSDAKPGYCVFGKVVEGMDVVDKIKAVQTGAQGRFPGDVPKTAIVIEKASIVP